MADDDNEDDEDEYSDIQCCTCGIEFKVTTKYKDLKQRTCGDFWCPNGHSLAYKKNMDEEDEDDEIVDKLRQENEQLKVTVRTLKCRLLGNSGVVDKVKVWLKGGLTK